MTRATLGFDVGTSSSKGVLVDEHGRVLRSAVRAHEPSRPAPAQFEMDGELWWREFLDVAAELTGPGDVEVTAVGLSGMGPCVLLTDAAGVPVRDAILYGVDTRATEQIARLTEELGEAAIVERCGSALTSQAVGPKLAWVRDNEPERYARARRLFMPASFLGFRLTGEYALDLHSASQCTPLFDAVALEWFAPWADSIAPDLELPPLLWPGDRVGVVRSAVAGIPAGTPVIAGTIDAWDEAISVGAHSPGDLMLMYGTSMFMIATTETMVRAPALWSTVGAFPGTRNVAGGMSTAGAITGWLRELAGGVDYPTLLAEAAASGPGARGLLMLPYFSGSRLDPEARGLLAGLRLDHSRGDLYRAALEAVAFGVRRDIEQMRAAGAPVRRVVAVGGGTQGELWTRIVSDATGLPQQVPTITIGASYGAAFLAAGLDGDPDIAAWNPTLRTVEPDADTRALYDERYAVYEEAIGATASLSRALARSTSITTPPSEDAS